jgi:glycosyltransferase involved in cell wall biosynthesis/GT2 family glycosyltransferase
LREAIRLAIFNCVGQAGGMIKALKTIYAALRSVPVLGLAVSHLVWTLKAVFGLPVIKSAAPPPKPARAADIRALQKTLLAAIEAAQASAPAPPSPVWPPAITRAPSTGRPAVSVVVNTLNRAKTLRQTLRALLQQRYPRFEIIVVNGPSTDATAEVLAAFAGQLRVGVCSEANLAKSRNIGVALAAGEVIAFIDDDALPEPDWLDALIIPFADGQVAGVGGSIRDRTGLSFQCRATACDRFGAAEQFDSLAAARLRHQPGAPRYLSLTGTNSAFRRRAMAEIGGFDEAYAYFLDETDVCLRLMDAGYDLTCAPEAEVHHSLAASALREADGVPIRLYPSVRSTAYFAVRHALPSLGAKAVAAHLATYAEDLKRYRRAEAARGAIDPARHRTLNRDIDQGLIDGLSAGFKPPQRARLAPPPVRTLTSRQAPPDRVRLCLMSQTYGRSGAGGIAVWTEALARGLADRGHEVTVITRTQGRASVAYQDGVWVHALAAPALGAPPSVPWAANLPRVVADPAEAAREEVMRILPRRAFDVAMGPIWDLEPAALLAQGQIPTAISLHTTYAQSRRFHPEWGRNPLYLRRHVEPIVAGERRLLDQAPLILANSRAVLDDLAMAFHLPDLAHGAVIIPHGLPDLAEGVVHRPPRPGVEVLFVGRLEPRKGIDTLLDAAFKVLTAETDIRFVIVGEDVATPGEPLLRESFKLRVAGTSFAERVAFLGRVSEAELLSRYAACDLLVAPSRYESFGLTLVEAMIFAKPCIACAVGGMAEVVQDGETGLLIPPGSSDALTGAVLALARDPDRRRRMGEAGRRRYTALFTADRMVTATAQALSRLKTGAHIPQAAARRTR